MAVTEKLMAQQRLQPLSAIAIQCDLLAVKTRHVIMLSLSTSVSVSGALPSCRLAENAAPSDCFDGGSILSCNTTLQYMIFALLQHYP